MTPEDKEGERLAEEWLRANDLDYQKYGDRRADRSAYDGLMNYEITPMLAEAFLAGRASRDGEIESLRRDEHSAAQRANRLGDQLARMQGVLAAVVRETEHGPLLTDGTIQAAREALKGIR